MGFLNPWALVVGGLAVGLPFAVHYLTKPRPQELPLSTIQFVFEAMTQRRSRQRLRDWLVLLLRCLAIALIAAAIARPLWRQSVIASVSNNSLIARVVLVDISQSMAAGRAGNQPISRAVPLAKKYLSSNGAGTLSAALVTVSAQPESVYQSLSTNLNVLSRRAGEIKPVPQAANAEAALLLASDLLEDAPENARREVVILSDFQRSDWGNLSMKGLPSDVRIQLESVALGNPSNIAIRRIDAADKLVVGRPAMISIEVQNDTSASRTVDCKLEIDGGESLVQRETLPIGLSTFSIEFVVESVSPKSGVVELVDPQAGMLGDDLPMDDFATFSIAAQTPPKTLLVSNQHPESIPSSSYYLQRASEQLFAEPRVNRVATDGLDEDRLNAADLILIDHAGRLPKQSIDNIIDRVRRGAGLLYFASGTVDAVNLISFSEAAASSLELPVRYLPPRAGAPRRDLVIDSLARRDSPFEIFGDSTDAAVGELHFGGGLRTEPLEEALEDRVLASLDDQSALLVLAACGGGKVAIFNTDLEYSNFAVRPAFIPLLGEVTGRLLRRDQSQTQFSCGESFVQLLPRAVGVQDELEIKPVGDWPMIDDGYGSIEVSGGGMLWSWDAPSERGVYGVYQKGNCISQVATNIPKSESELSFLKPEAFNLQERQQSDQQVAFRDATESTDDKDRFWNVLLSMCVLGLLAEMVTLAGFRH
ncbi:MAG: BatA domain-containing protein [Planctomycetota bacterium]